MALSPSCRAQPDTSPYSVLRRRFKDRRPPPLPGCPDNNLTEQQQGLGLPPGEKVPGDALSRFPGMKKGGRLGEDTHHA